jgi:hypothetical protein
MANIAIFDLIFRTILKIPNSVIAQYPQFTDQVLYLLLIPHIIVFLFVFWLIKGVIPEHRGLGYLVGVGAYIFFILSGWYGNFINIFILWWQILLGLALFFILASRFIRPSAVREMFSIASRATRKLTKKSKEQDKLEKEIKSIQRQIEALEQKYPPATRPRLIETEIGELYRRKAEKEAELDEL